MGLNAREQQAWRALRASRRLLFDRRTHTLNFGSGGTRGRSERKQVYSGYSPALAAEALRSQGWDDAAIAAALPAVILARFPAFAGSWNGYLAGMGFMHELERFPAAVTEEYEQRYQLSQLKTEIERLAQQGPLALANPQQLAHSIGLINKLQAQAASDPAAHPALPALTGYHGMHPLLAQAVVLYQQAVPWWGIALIFFFAVLAGSVFIGALINPHSPSFNEGRGAGPAQYVVAPLFSLLFFAVGTWLWRDAPRRNKAWQDALGQWQEGPGR